MSRESDEALRSADTPNPLGLNDDSAQYSGQSIQSADVLIENAGGVASWLIINGEKTYIAPGESYRMPRTHCIAGAFVGQSEEFIKSGKCNFPACGCKVGDVMRENEELKRIRDLCVKSLVKATGRNEESIRDAPYTCASKHAAEVAALRSATRAITATQIHDVYQEEFYRKDKTGKALAHVTHADLIKAVIHRLLGVEIQNHEN